MLTCQSSYDQRGKTSTLDVRQLEFIALSLFPSTHKETQVFIILQVHTGISYMVIAWQDHKGILPRHILKARLFQKEKKGEEI